MTEEQKHYHIKEIAEDYVSKSWNTFLDLEEIDLVMAGIGVGKIIASEQEKRIEELENENKIFKKANEIIAKQRDDRDVDISILENRIEELEARIEKMKCCQNCDNWNWKHNKCEKKLKGDCFKASKWQLRR